MDITNSEPAGGLSELLTWWGIGLIIGSILFTFSVGFIVSFQTGLISSVSVLVTVGIVTIESWNRELKEDGYASLSQLYSSYIAVLFLFIAIFMVLSRMVGLLGGLGLSLAISLTYVIILNSVAFRGIEEYETAVETYKGPSVVYLPDGPYFDHIEELAHQNKNSTEENSVTKD
jgi:hypothetical protein